MSVRKTFLKLHLYLGLFSAIFLLIVALSGSILAFKTHLDQWMNANLWNVSPDSQMLPEEQLINIVEKDAGTAQVITVHMPRRSNLAQVMDVAKPGVQMDSENRIDPDDLSYVFINPYTGDILGRRMGLSKSEKFMQVVNRIHLSLLAGAVGKAIVKIATIVLFFEVFLGFYLWFYIRRTSIKWDASWLRISFDVHNVLGIYGGLFISIAVFSAVVMILGPIIYKARHLSRFPSHSAHRVESTPVPGAAPISIDRAIEIAHQAIPNSTPDMLRLPVHPKDVFDISMRVPQETSEGVDSGAMIDQYSGEVLQRRDYRTEAAHFRFVSLMRSLHTGDIYGLPSHIIVCISGFLITTMIATGVVIWGKKTGHLKAIRSNTMCPQIYCKHASQQKGARQSEDRSSEWLQ